MTYRAGRHFLQVPGPSNVPDRILRAIAQPTIDHRGADFAKLGAEVLAGMKAVLKTTQPVIIYPASGTGAWEAALVNLLSPGDRVLMFETGHFALLWRQMAERLSLVVDLVPGDWRSGVSPVHLEEKLCGGQGAPHQGRLLRPQRDLDRRDLGHPRRPQDNRRGQPPCPAHRRHDLFSRLDGLSPRRVGRRCDRRRLAEGADAAARLELQRRRQEGARRRGAGTAAALLLALGGDARPQPHRLLPLYAGDQPPLRVARGARHAA